MKKRVILFASILPFLGLICTSCNQNPKDATEKKETKDANVVMKDYGAEPTVLNIEDYTMANTNFRTVLWTGNHLQVTLMTIPVQGEVGLEQHLTTDQFLRVEDGEAKVMMGDSKEALTFTKAVGKDFVILVPAGKWHNIINAGNKPLKLYSIYAPPEHPHGAVHKTHQDAIEAEGDHH